MKKLLGPALAVFAVQFVIGCSAPSPSEIRPRQAAVASAHPLANAAGLEIVAQGGNAFDAAVAVAAALGVVEPYASGLGGGGFFLLHRASDGFEVLIDARESAPREASRDMYLDETGERVARASLDGPKAAAIPGTPAALDWIAKRYGKLALERSLAPAERLARDGFEAHSRYLSAARYSEKRLQGRAAAIFLEKGAAPEPGFVIRQTGLATTLQRLATGGRDGFYTGAVANDLVHAVREAGGIWAGDDLAGYQVLERTPLKLRYRELTITAPPLPSSAGITLAQCLNILELFPIAAMAETERAHHVIEALRRGFQDRTRFLGDVRDAPIARLTSKSYARERASGISADRATASAPLDAPDEGEHTTHFSIVDADGNRVAATLTINTIFGSGLSRGKPEFFSTTK